MYRVNEIFNSVQGEGFHSGKQMIFIRFSGCNRSCVYCDTNHADYTEMDITSILQRVQDLRNGYSNTCVVLTGGEPMVQENLRELVDALQYNMISVHMETNGYNYSNIPRAINWVTYSPKDNELSASVINNYFDELKYICDTFEIENTTALTIPKYVQPESGKIKEALEYLKHDKSWQLSVQTQKLIGIK